MTNETDQRDPWNEFFIEEFVNLDDPDQDDYEDSELLDLPINAFLNDDEALTPDEIFFLIDYCLNLIRYDHEVEVSLEGLTVLQLPALLRQIEQELTDSHLARSFYVSTPDYPTFDDFLDTLHQLLYYLSLMCHSITSAESLEDEEKRVLRYREDQENDEAVLTLAKNALMEIGRSSENVRLLKQLLPKYEEMLAGTRRLLVEEERLYWLQRKEQDPGERIELIHRLDQAHAKRIARHGQQSQLRKQLQYEIDKKGTFSDGPGAGTDGGDSGSY